MISLTPQELSDALKVEAGSLAVFGVSTDSRTLQFGDLFVALKGEAYDGHEFVPAAFAAGAWGAVVQMGSVIAGDADWQPPGDYPLVRVPDTVRALGLIARAVRRKSSARVIAVTGSVGKTGTKDLLAAMASAVGPVVATRANENNEIGVPLTLLRIEEDTAVVIVEMGTRGHGQIRSLAAVAEPDVGLVTAIAPVHLELLGTLADVARAKAELIEELQAGGVGVIPAEAPHLDARLKDSERPLVRFALGRERGADVVGTVLDAHEGRSRLELRWPEGRAQVDLPFAVRHRLENTVAATAALYASGLPLEECIPALRSAAFTPGRGDELSVGSWLVIDDTYNANPTACRLAIDSLVERALQRGGRAVAILGDMLELGSEEERYHHAVGMYAAEAGVALLVGYGLLSRSTVEGFDAVCRQRHQRATLLEPPSLLGEDERGSSYHLGDVIDGLDSLERYLRYGDTVLVKASRGMRMERVVQHLLSRAPHSGAGIGPEKAG